MPARSSPTRRTRRRALDCPQELTATQNFRNLTFPAQTYGAATVASTTHRRAIEDRTTLKAVTSANAAGISQEVVDDYAGPTVFRHARAAPPSIPVAAPASPGGTAPAAATTTVTVDAEGQTATPAFLIDPLAGPRVHDHPGWCPDAGPDRRNRYRPRRRQRELRRDDSDHHGAACGAGARSEPQSGTRRRRPHHERPARVAQVPSVMTARSANSASMADCV